MTDQDKTAATPGTPAEPPRTFLEELEVTGAELVERVRELAREGSARRVTIFSEDGEELMGMSLTLGTVAGGLVVLSAPALAALGALAALVTHVRVVVTRDGVARPDPTA
ncbi:DUF4342 domain-containing protein [Deinococcus sp. MIMF12]|uniref:DUF4342 domain-containing protein n=1 Tax=Deinococcus rhizophilus TaxID=3049544 RepID=A0ABT7JKM7_9DEIO|nr:DUF4342 domain-containing protein [Deinococcus rhizophilus]MDL2345521.1 DUF4342 domain-containing protein [Deinococcus rhizophilus]